MGVVPPEPGFLPGLRELCSAAGSLLVFDEVISGFRIGLGGAQARYEVAPDLTVLGKVMGGGFPCAAFGGRREVMERLAPVGPVYQAGTLSGNPVAVAAGIAALDLARELDPYPSLAAAAEAIAEGLAAALAGRGIAATVNRAGPMFSLFFGAGPVRDFEGAARPTTSATRGSSTTSSSAGSGCRPRATRCGPSGPSTGAPRSSGSSTRPRRSRAEA